MLALLLPLSLAQAAECTCQFREPLEGVLARSKAVVVVEQQSSSSSFTYQSAGAEVGTRIQRSLSAKAKVVEVLRGELVQDAVIDVRYDELDCLLDTETVATRRLAGSGGVCSGSGLELGQSGGGFLGGQPSGATAPKQRVYFLGNADDDGVYTLLRTESTDRLPALRAAPTDRRALMQGPLEEDGMHPSLAGLGWLAGTWSDGPLGQGTQEVWTQDAKGRLTGTGTFHKDGAVAFTEQLSIELVDGKVVYVALPQGAEGPTHFALVEQSGTRAVFRNPDHDWPTEISYTLGENGRLTTRASGPERDLVAHMDRVTTE